MANLCYNKVVVTGASKELIDFTNKFEENGITAFLPTPKELNERKAPFAGTEEEEKRLISKYGAADWYNWRLENWGTKWDVDIFSADLGCFEFTTPWSPPIEAFTKISEMYPKLIFNMVYSESGMGFLGKAVFEGGTVDDQTFDWDSRFEEGVWPITIQVIDLESTLDDLLEFLDEDFQSKYSDCIQKYVSEDLKWNEEKDEIRKLFEALNDEDEDYIKSICKNR